MLSAKSQNTYYSQGTDNFSTTSNWDTNSGGGGSNPADLADMQDGNDSFIIQDGHTITLDNNFDINNLTVGQGVSGALVIGNDATARQLIVQGTTITGVGATISIGAFNATHSFSIQGTVTNNGTIDLQNSSSQVANVILDGIFSISGNSPQFNNITFNTGTVTASVAFDIEANVIIEDGATFVDGDFTHTVAGDWTENGTGAMTGFGTVQMDATLVQSIKTASVFNNLTFNGGSIATISGAATDAILTVNGNLLITNNTDVSTSSRNTMNGNFTVDDGSTYTANDGRIIFSSANSQTIDIGTNVTFDEVYFDNGGAANPKTIVGNYKANDQTRVYDDAVIDGAGDQTLQELRLDGGCNFSGSMTFTGSNIHDDNDNDCTLGTASIKIEGSVHITNNTTLRIYADVDLISGYLDINDGTALVQEGASKTLTAKASSILYIQGSDNFPSGFTTYTFETNSQCRYDGALAQTIRGNINYSIVYAQNNFTKTVDAPLNIDGILYLRSATTLNLSTYSHTFASNIDNDSNSSIISTGTVTMDATDANQTIEIAGTGSYTFNNLIFTSTATSAVRTKNIDDDIIVNGNFTITNTGGSVANYNILDIDANSITNDGGDIATMGSNIELRTSGETNFELSMISFGSVSMDPNSLIRFDGAAQNIPGGFTYPTIEFYTTGNKTATGSIDINGNVTRTGGTPVFIDGGFSHTCSGDWIMDQDYTTMTGTMTFDGADQLIDESDFYNVIFAGTGTKTLDNDFTGDGNLNVDNDLTINTGVTLAASINSITIEGNWKNTDGIFTQTTGTSTLDGTQSSRTITSNSSSYFGNLTINKTGGNRTVNALSDIDANLDFTLTANNAYFDLNGFDLYVGEDWYYNTGAGFIHNNGTVIFDGASNDQLIRNYEAANEFYNVEFKNAGVKRIYDTDMDINGNVTIYSGATLNTSDNDRNLEVQGDWLNSGTFLSDRDVIFDGANQNISSSNFHDVHFDGIAKDLTETKTLTGNITLSGELRILDGVTLDVSASNYSITVEERWYNNDGANTGVFNPRAGILTFNGAAENELYTGGSTAGKQFYNLVVNLTASQVEIKDDIRIQNDLTILNGEFETDAFDVYLGGSLINNDIFSHNNTSSQITFEATSGTHEFKPGTSVFRDIIFDAPNAVFTLESDLTINTDRYRTFVLNNGYLDLNSYDISLLARDGHIDINGGTFEVDASAVITLGQDGYYTNDGGVIMLVGDSGADATLTSNQVSTGNYFTFLQNSGTFHAKYYHVEKIQGSGLEIAGGTVDAINNFSEGSFNDGYGPSGAYIVLTGIDLGAGITATNVSFSSGPNSNVARLSGSGAITFENSGGDFNGAAYESDGGGLINWTFPGGIFWDGSVGDSDWNSALNWTSNSVPTAGQNIFLEHANGGVAGSYTVNITLSDAVCNRLALDAEGGNAITLVLNGFELKVNENFDLSASTILTQTNATDTLFIAGSWSNGGTFNENLSVVVFNGTGGTSNIATGGASDSFNDLVFDADGAIYSFSSAIDIANDVKLIAGTINAGSSNMTVDGDWISSGATFDPGTAIVTFSGANQDISGGTFNDFETNGSGTKTLSGNISVADDIRIRTGTVLDGASKMIYVTDNWQNDVGDAGFTQTGAGSVIFNGAGQNIGNSASATTFNNVYFQGTGTKDITVDLTVNNNMFIQSGIDRVDVQSAISITGFGAANTLNMTGGELRIEGTNNFPLGFEDVSLSSGIVRYFSDLDQSIYATTYFDLIMENSGSIKTDKTLLGDITVKDDLTFNDTKSTLDVAGYTITLTDAFTFGTGNVITWNNGTLIHDGDGWNIDTDLTEFHNLILKGSGTKLLQGNLDITGDVSVQASGVTLRMEAFTMDCSGASKSFTMNAGTFLRTDIASGSYAFPTSFATYSIDETSRVTIEGTGDRDIFCGVTYGELYLTNLGNATMDANLDVNGIFDMNNNPTLVDGGFDLNLAGSTVDIRDYTPGNNTITFDGTTQDIHKGEGLDPDIISFNNIVFAGSGTKSMNSGYDQFDIAGIVIINSGVTVDSDEDWLFAGSTWTNNGTFDNTGGNFTMDGIAGQTFDPGASNIFNTLTISNGGGSKVIINNGFDLNGTLTVDGTATLDMGSITHNIASTTFAIAGTWTTTNANLTFDSDGTQSIPALTAKDIICTGITTTKILTGNWSIDDLTINSGSTLDVGDGLDYSITTTGNWTNNGTFRDRNGTVAFESDNTTAKTIYNNGNNFWQVSFNQAQTNTRIYTLEDDFDIENILTIGSGATLGINSHNLTLGRDNDPGIIETHTVEAGGVLEVDANAVLQFNNVDGTSVLNVAGTFKVVGTSGNIATVTNETNNANRRTDINITTGTMSAQYYHFKYLDSDGLDVQATASLDATNNFSNGSWSEISTSGSGTHRYLILNASDPGGTIDNVTFNHGGTPTVGVHYNVQRDAGADIITFDGTINGELAGSTYEDDSGNKIVWPVITAVTWDGSVSTDWHTAENWTPSGVPTSLNNVIIPSAGNNPVINTSNATCKGLQITTGTLTIDAAYDLTVAEDVEVGTSTNSGILAIGNTGSTISVGGGWTRGTNGTFINGSSTVTFTSGTGIETIDPDNSAFYNIIFNGGATFQLTGLAIDIDGSMTISNGNITTMTNNYVLTVAGDINNSGGSFSTAINGTIQLDGAAQSITSMTFDNLEVSGTGTKTFNGTNAINDLLTVNSTLTVAAAGSLDMNDDVTIEVGGTFNDGGESHTFSGSVWTGSGTYTGLGTVTFDGTSNVDLYESSFNNVIFNGTGNVELYGDVNVTGNFYIDSTINQFYIYTYQVDNTSGTGTFTLEELEYVHVRGANNFPSGFSTYTLGANSRTYYNGTMDQSIAGITYGHLYLSNATTKTLAGNIDINGDLYFNEATLDVSTSNYKINIADDWYNTTSGSFTARSGEVIFDGNLRQDISISTSGTNIFYKLTINKSADIAYSQNTIQQTIQENFRVLSGTFSANGDEIYIGGNLSVTGGTISQSGTIILNKASGSATIQSNGSLLNNLTVNSGATYTLQDNLSVENNFVLTSGVFDGNGMTVEMGGSLDVVDISGTYKVGENGYLKLGANVSLTVSSGAIFYAVGTASGNAFITNRSGTNRYNFTIDGTIHAKYYEFEYMNSGGIYVTSSGTIDATNNFSYGSFANPISAGTCLRIENTQSFTDPSHILDVNFPDNPGGGATNVKKVTAVSGNLEFYNATGTFSGASFENDPGALIDWTGPVTLTWDGSKNSDWNDVDNWTASSGPNKIPTVDEDVIVANALNQPEISTVPGTCKSLTINSGSFMTITSADATVDLVIVGNLDIQGTFSMSSTNDYVEVDGDWDLNGGMFTNGQGTVEMKSTTGSQALNCGATPFYNLIINSVGLVEISAVLNISNDLTITTGTLDVTATDYTVNVSGSFSNSGTFNSQNGKLVLKSTTVGTETFNPGVSSYYNVDIDAGASTIYQLSTNNFTVNEGLDILGGTLDLNSLTINLGDGSGIDNLNIVGTLNIDENAFLKLESGASLTVNSGGIFKAVGIDDLNVATVSNQGSGTYSFAVNSGGTIHANYYMFEYMNATGIQVKAGAYIDEGTNNFSNGTWSNGTAGGRYLLLENDFTGDFTADALQFNVGPDVNIKRITGTNSIIVNDGFGAIGGYVFEEDDAAAETGRVQWTYTNALYTWNGGDGLWNTATNWDISTGGNGVPTSTANVVIPNSGTDVVLGATSDGVALNVTIHSGATLTVSGNYNLTVDGSLDNNGTFTIVDGSSSSITILDTWSNNGTFNAGNSSTVILTAVTGTKSITSGGSIFNNLHLNSGGTATFTTLSSLDINGTLTLQAGTLEVTDPSHNLNIAGNWSNTGGSFTNGSSTVTFDGAAQTISGAGTETFYDIVFAGTGTKTLSSDILVNNNVTISSTLSISDNESIELKGNWANSGALSHAGVSTVSFTGTSTQSITNTGGVDYNGFTLNNTSGIFPQILLNDPVNIDGVLTLTDGVMETSSVDIITLTTTGSLSGGTTSASYIDGPMGRNGTSNFVFPVGDGTIFARIGVSGMATSADLTAEYFDGAYADISSFGTGVRKVSKIEYWDLSRSAGTGEPFVSVYWEDGARSFITDASTLIVGHYTGGQWENMGKSLTGDANSGHVQSTTAFSSFSPVIIADEVGGSNPLPIELTHFAAHVEDNNVMVNWETASEENSSYFIIERSLDGEFVETIGVIDGAGNSSLPIKYDYLDENPLIGTSYYRLVQFDYNGDSKTYNWKSVVYNRSNSISESFKLNIFPNPAIQSEMTVELVVENPGKFNLEVYSVVGERIFIKNIEIVDRSQIYQLQLNELSVLPQGIYLLNVTGNNHSQQIRFIIK